MKFSLIFDHKRVVLSRFPSDDDFDVDGPFGLTAARKLDDTAVVMKFATYMTGRYPETETEIKPNLNS